MIGSRTVSRCRGVSVFLINVSDACDRGSIVVTFCVHTPPHTLTRLAIRGSLISSYVDVLDVNPEYN